MFELIDRMIRLLGIEINRIVNQLAIISTLLISVLLLIEKNTTENAFEWIIGLGSNSLFFIATIVVAMIPGVFLCLDDQEYGFDLMIKQKCSDDVYSWSRIIVVYISSSLIWSIGFVLSLIYKLVIGGFSVVNTDYGFIANGFLLADNKNALYVLFVIIQLSSFVGLMSIMGLIAATLTNNRMLSMVLPPLLLKAEDLFVCVHIGTASPKFCLYSFYMLWVGSLDYDPLDNSFWVRIIMFIIMLILLCSIYFYIRWGDEK